MHIQEKVSYKKVKVVKTKGEAQFDTGEEVPKSAVAKVFYNFRHKFMPIVYNFNEQYEYRYLLGIFLFLLIVFNVTLIIYPILSDSRKLLLYEISKRGMPTLKRLTGGGTLSMGELGMLIALRMLQYGFMTS